MRFRRVLLVSTPGAPAHAALATLRGVAPDCELLWIVLLVASTVALGLAAG